MDELPRIAGLLEWPMIIGPTSLGESGWPEVLREAPPNWTQQPFPQKIKMSPKKGPFQRFNHHFFFSCYVSLMGSNFSSIGYANSGASVIHPYIFHSLLIDSLAHCLNYRHLEVFGASSKRSSGWSLLPGPNISAAPWCATRSEVRAKSFPPPCSPVAAIKAFSGTVESLMDEAIFHDFFVVVGWEVIWSSKMKELTSGMILICRYHYHQIFVYFIVGRFSNSQREKICDSNSTIIVIFWRFVIFTSEHLGKFPGCLVFFFANWLRKHIIFGKSFLKNGIQLL